MTVNVPDGTPGPRRHRQGPSPVEGERVRPLTRLQVEDRWQDLGDLYARTSGGGPWAWAGSRAAFLRRLSGDVRRPGFALLIAETVVHEETTVLTGCAYGFPVPADGTWGHHPDAGLPPRLLPLAAAGGLFAVCGILVPHRVRARDQDRDWNLARRLQKRLLTDHAATLGVMLVGRGEAERLEALRAWGWRFAEGEPRNGTSRGLGTGPWRALVVGP